MAGRKLSGIWVPVQLDTSRIESDLTKVNQKIGAALSQTQKHFEGTLNTAKFGNAFVGVLKNIGSVKDGIDALAKSQSIDVPTYKFRALGQQIGLTALETKKMYQELGSAQAINQQVQNLNNYQKTMDLTGKQALALAEKWKMSEQAILKFAQGSSELSKSENLMFSLAKAADKTTEELKNMGFKMTESGLLMQSGLKPISTEMDKLAAKYRELAKLSGTTASQKGFEQFVNTSEMNKAVSSIKELYNTSKMSETELYGLAKSLKLNSDYMKELGLVTTSSGLQIRKDLNSISLEGDKLAAKYRELAKLSGTTASQKGFEQFVNTGELTNSVKAFKELYNISKMSEEQQHRLASSLGKSTEFMKELGLSVTRDGKLITQSMKDATAEAERLVSSYEKLTKQSGVKASNEGFQQFVKTDEINKQVAAFKQLIDISGKTEAQIYNLAKSANLPVEAMRKLGISVTDSGNLIQTMGLKISDTGKMVQTALKPLQTTVDVMQRINPQVKLTEQAFNKLNPVLQKFQTLQASNSRIKGIADAYNLDIAGLIKYRKELQITTQELNEYIEQQKRASSGGRGVLGVLTPYSASAGVQSAAAAFGVSFGAYGMAELTKSAYQTALQLENFQIALESVYKDGNRAGAALQFVKDTTDDLGISMLSSAQGAKKLFAAAQGTSLQEDVYNIYDSFSQMGAALRLTGSEMDSVFLALSQSISKGKLSAEEIRLQLAERMPGAVQILAKSMNVTTVELDKMFQAGTVGLENLVLMADEVRKTYSQGAENASTGLQAEINRLGNSWNYLKAEFADNETAAELVRTINNVVTSLRSMAPAIIDNTKYIVKLGIAMTTAFVGAKLVTGMRALVTYITTTMIPALAGATTSATNFGAAMKLIGGLSVAKFAGLVGIGVAMVALYEAATKSKTPLTDSTELLDQLGGQADKTATQIRNLNAEMVKNQLTLARSDFGKQLREMGDYRKEFSEIVKDIRDEFNFIETSSLGGGNAISLTAANNFPKQAQDLLSQVKDLGSQLRQEIRTATTPEDRSEIIDSYVIKYKLLREELHDLGVSADSLKILDKWTSGMITSAKNISATSTLISDLNKHLKETEQITASGFNFKDYENSLKALAEYGEKSPIGELQKTQSELQGLAYNVSQAEKEYAKYANVVYDTASAQESANKMMAEHKKVLSAALSEAASSPQKMAGLLTALQSLVDKGDMTVESLQRVKAAINDVANSEINIKVNTLSTSLLNDYFKKQLPDNIKAASDVLKSAFTDEALLPTNFAQTQKAMQQLGKNLSSGQTWEVASKGIVGLRENAEGMADAFQTAVNMSKNVYVPSKSTGSSGSKTVTQARQAQTKSTQLLLDLEKKREELLAKIAGDEVKSFEATNKAYIEKTKNQMTSLKLTEAQRASLEKELGLYVQASEQFAAYTAKKEEEEKDKERLSFYSQLSDYLNDANLKMQVLNRSIAEQREEWNRLSIPQEFQDQMAYLQTLEIRTDWMAGLERGFMSLQESALDFSATFEEGITSASSSAASAFSEFVMSGSKDWNALLNNILTSWAEMAIQMASTQLFQMIFGGIGGMFNFGGSGGVNIGGGIASSLGSIAAGAYHSGGIAGGTPTFTKAVPMSFFDNAPKYHTGGIAGNEIPAILQRGEGVFTQEQMRHLAPSGSSTQVVSVSPIINIHNSSKEEVTTQSSTDNIGNPVIDVMIGNMAAKQIFATPGSQANRMLRNATGQTGVQKR